MKPSRCRSLLSLLLITFVVGQTAPLKIARAGEDLQVTLPPIIYAVVGIKTNIYFDNIVLVKDTTAYQFKFTCDLGMTQAQRWTLTATKQQLGDHPLSLQVNASDGTPLAKSNTIVRVIRIQSKSQKPLKLLIIGDSLTHATTYCNEIARLLSQPNNPPWKMLGTHKPTSATDGVAHEGYGGWTWQRFASHFEPNPDGTYKKRSSPFVYQSSAGKSKLNVTKYFDEHCDGEIPDIIVIMLGINDCFSANSNDPTSINSRVDTMFEHANILLGALQSAAPKARIGICLTTPGNSRQEAFQANYQDRYTRWGWKRIQHQLVQRQIAFVQSAQKQDEPLFIIATQLNLDTVDGYPVNNGVHPNAAGYQQIGATIYAAIMANLIDR
ncbi:MAG: SGNH/GDSL hydrolase family protein [Planctomycetaceae bacterium]|jgi:lysophospholipase L1-like esterase|nr:SGNH/GDSL hydrolase family protein [Planctomycetaceae bacterium]